MTTESSPPAAVKPRTLPLAERSDHLSAVMLLVEWADRFIRDERTVRYSLDYHATGPNAGGYTVELYVEDFEQGSTKWARSASAAALAAIDELDELARASDEPEDPAAVERDRRTDEAYDLTR